MSKTVQDQSKKTLLQLFGLFFFNKRETTVVFWIAFAVFGIVSYTTLMQRQGFPNIDVPISVVSGTYFVNDKQAVDTQIARPVSEIIANLPAVKTVSSTSGDNFFLLTIQYKDGNSSAGGNAIVQNALDTAHVLPAAAKVAYKAIDAGRFVEQSDLLLSISSRTSISAQALQDRAQAVAAEMAKTKGVKKSTLITQIETGTNPATGQQQSEQRSFDRIGVHDGSGAVVFADAATVGLQAGPSTDALKLYDAVMKRIEELKTDQSYSDVKITVSADFAEDIRSQISNLQTNLLEGLFVVIVVSCLLISWRAGLATALSMATVLLITIATLYATGTSLNTITLFALILSLGLIVDDTTIMVEAIDAGKASGKTKDEVVATAIKRVARASTTGTITTILAFAPMLFISGILGSFIRILPVSIIIALAVSLLISLSLVPFFAHFLLVGKLNAKPTRNPIAKAEKWISGRLAGAVSVGYRSRAKRYGYGTVALFVSLLLFAGSLPYFGKLKFDIFPNTKDSNTISIALQYPDNTSIADAQAAADKANIIAGDTLGKNMVRLSYQSSGSTTTATAVVQLLSYKERSTKSPQLVADLQMAYGGFAGATVKVNQVDAGPPKDDYPFAVRIFEDDTPKATLLANNIKAYLQGHTVKRLNGQSATIVRTELSNSSSLRRDQGRRYIEVRAGFDATDVSALVDPAKNLVQDKYTDARLQPFGIGKSALSFDFGNESNNQDSFKSMLLAFPILLGVMFVLLLYQFRSFLQPLLIFMAIPFSFFGVAAGLFYTDNPLSFFVLVGFFALIGIAVNNTILLTDFANQARDSGANRYDAMAQAIEARFRPLVTTSLTSVVALIPLALSDPFWQSLSVTLIFGLLSSTLLVIISFPYLYLIVEWVRDVGHRLWRRELWRPLQLVLDVVVFPVRLLRFIFWVAFSWHK